MTLTFLLAFIALTPSTSWGVDAQRALAVWHQQADQGNAQAQNSIGDCYANGWGVTKDPAEAMRWYRKAADQRYEDAQFNIGSMYEYGEGVKEDPVQAYMWFSLSGADKTGGNPGVAYRFKKLAEKMTPKQVEEAKRLANAWKPTTNHKATLAGTQSETCTPTGSDYEALALSPSRLTPEGFLALEPARQKLVCSTRAFSKQVEMQGGFIDKMERYSPKYLGPSENSLIVAASDDYLQRLLKSKGF